jgi:hypothetical protein
MAISRATALFIGFVTAASTSMTFAAGCAQPGFAGGSGGSGPLSPSVFATWDAHYQPPPGQVVADPAQVPLMLDLLVLWRGSPGWLDGVTFASTAGSSPGTGGSDGEHTVKTAGQSFEVRFDRRADTVDVQGRTIALHGANVLLLDDVGNAGGLTVAGTITVRAAMSSGPPAQGGPNTHPLAELFHGSAELFDYLRCDPAFADPNDPAAPMKLRSCEELR